MGSCVSRHDQVHYVLSTDREHTKEKNKTYSEKKEVTKDDGLLAIPDRNSYTSGGFQVSNSNSYSSSGSKSSVTITRFPRSHCSQRKEKRIWRWLSDIDIGPEPITPVVNVSPAYNSRSTRS
eukprot:gb/GECH01012567.1/.p1 GENE.gb/GECH01012567.1/~~gb/GECH01012567.1/.p1  ORF type:complete len:122 (+),score=14.35 gb/GECH01012567.1/:1-366(+)